MIKISYPCFWKIEDGGRGFQWAEKEDVAKKHRPTVQTQQFNEYSEG